MYYDSSDDEDNVTIDAYEGISLASPFHMKSHLTIKKLKNIRSENAILGHVPENGQTHQHFLQDPPIPGKKKPGSKNRSPSKFTAALQSVKKILDGLPSSPQEQSEFPNTIVPSFRGILWQSNINPTDLFFSTRVQWVDEYQYSSKVFKMADVNIAQHTLAKFANNKDLCESYKKHDLSLLDALIPNQLSIENAKLTTGANELKELFDYADLIKQPFQDWFVQFPNMRHCKKLQNSELSLSEILSYIYVNNYNQFKETFSSFNDVLNTLDNNKPGVLQLKQYYQTLALTDEVLETGIPYLSEGQIPRHALLYSFGVKAYATGEKKSAKPLYENDLKPKLNKSYLGKIFISQNPHTLFHSNDKTLYVPGFDKAYGGGVISKAIIGELEIQSRAANLQGTIKKDINTKLPKFHHKNVPARYNAKYGLDENLYNEFKETFEFLLSNNEHGCLSWIYLETIVIAHLIQFHEIQLYKYSNKMAQDIDKEIFWTDRHEKAISNPLAL